MKEGASNPFAESESESESEGDPTDPPADDDSGDATATSESEEHDRDREPTADSERSPAADVGQDTDTDANGGQTGDVERSVTREDLPYTLARDSVKDQRPSVHQLFVQEETDRAATEAERELEDALGEDLYRLDAREAIYLAGMQNLDDAVAVLRRWGYDL